MQADAARKRLRTAIWTLRKMGLDSVILTRDDGYLFDPLIAIEWSH
jgi:DNA-binding SARP family transcriptional activator